jgi:hypothetical protein
MITVVNLHVPYVGVPNFIKQTLLESTDSGDFNTPLSPIVRLSRPKKSTKKPQN